MLLPVCCVQDLSYNWEVTCLLKNTACPNLSFLTVQMSNWLSKKSRLYFYLYIVSKTLTRLKGDLNYDWESCQSFEKYCLYKFVIFSLSKKLSVQKDRWMGH